MTGGVQIKLQILLPYVHGYWMMHTEYSGEFTGFGRHHSKIEFLGRDTLTVSSS